jgi:DNA-binding transcriptional LysR family regulator
MMTGIAKYAGRGAAGCLRLGFYNSLSAGNLRATLHDYAQRFPAVEIRTVEASRERLLDDLKIGAIDIAIVTGDPFERPTARLFVVLYPSDLLRGPCDPITKGRVASRARGLLGPYHWQSRDRCLIRSRSGSRAPLMLGPDFPRGTVV